MSAGVWGCLARHPKRAGLDYSAGCAPPVFFFFLNPCRIGHLENTCTQGVCAPGRFRGSGLGWCCWRAAPEGEGPRGRVLAGVFVPGCPTPGVDSACFERPFLGEVSTSFREISAPCRPALCRPVPCRPAPCRPAHKVVRKLRSAPACPVCVEFAQTDTNWHKLAQTGANWHKLTQTGAN